ARSMAKGCDAARDAVERQRKHAWPEHLQDHLRRARVLPAPRRFRVPPDHLAKMREDPREPRDPRLVIHVFDAATDLRQLVRAHRGVADEDHPPIGPVGAYELERAEPLVAPARVVAPDVIVDAVVEIEILEMAE